MFWSWTGVRKAMHGMAPSSFSQGKNWRVSVAGWGHDHCLLALWRCDCCDCVAEMGDIQLHCLHQDTDCTQEAFQINSAWPESNRNLASSWQCQVAHKSEDLGSHHRIWCDSIMPPTLQPQCSTLRFLLVWSSEWCNLQYEVWDWWCDSHNENLPVRAGQGMVPTRLTHTYFSLVQGCRSEQKLVET